MLSSIINAIATNGIRIAYIVAFLAMVVVGMMLHISTLLAVAIGVVVMLPIAIADLVVSRRRKRAAADR